jgi:RNA polymerase sigma-70 factor, ECF subfamily
VVRTHVKQIERKPLLLSGDLADTLAAEIIATPEQSNQRLAILAECAKKLGGDALDLLRRCYVKNEKIKDVAAELGRSLAGTYQALSRIRRELFNCVQERIRREDGQ